MKLFGFIVLDETDTEKAISGDFKIKNLKFENRRVYKSFKEACHRAPPKGITVLKLEFNVTDEEIGNAIRSTAWGIYDPMEFYFEVVETYERTEK